MERDQTMSGPKISEVELERQRQAELERQRQERLRRLREAAEQYQQIITRYEKLKTLIASAAEKELKLIGTVEELDLAREAYISVNTAIRLEINNQIALPIPGEPEEIITLGHAAKDKLSSLEKSFEKGLSEFADRLSFYYSSQSELASSKAFSAALDAIEREKKWEYSNFRFDFSEDQQDTPVSDSGSSEIEINIEQIISECITLMNDSAINQADRRRLMAVLDELQKNAGDTAVQNGIAAQYNALRGSVKRNIREFNDYYLQYSILYAECIRMVGENKNPALQFLPKTAFSSIANLEKEIQRLDMLTKSENEQEYIRLQMDEVMKLFGYNISESIILRGSSKGRHFLFESDKGDAPVHCFLSDANNIMLETVGLDNLDDSNTEGYDGIAVVNLTDAERAGIVEQQKSFCGMHPRIVDELRKRGVLLAHVKLTEVGGEHAKVLKIKGKRSTLRQDGKRAYIRHEEKKLRAIKD